MLDSQDICVGVLYCCTAWRATRSAPCHCFKVCSKAQPCAGMHHAHVKNWICLLWQVFYQEVALCEQASALNKCLVRDVTTVQSRCYHNCLECLLALHKGCTRKRIAISLVKNLLPTHHCAQKQPGPSCQPFRALTHPSILIKAAGGNTQQYHII